MMEEDHIISFGDDFDDDDEFADLFSFATAAPTDAPASSPSRAQSSPKKPIADYKEVMASVMPLPPTHHDDDDESSGHDSFLELLEQQIEPVTLLDHPTAANTTTSSKDKSTDLDNSDLKMQEILDWLDQEDEDQEAARQQQQEGNGETELLPPSMRPPPPEEPTPPVPTQVEEPEPQFETLEQAVKSSKSSLSQIRRLLQAEGFQVSADVRPYLWCRVVCGKTLEDTLRSSVADSFQQWLEHNQSLLQGNDDTAVESSSPVGEGSSPIIMTPEESTPTDTAKPSTDKEQSGGGGEDEEDGIVDITDELSQQASAEDTKESSSSAPPQTQSTTVKTLTLYQKAQRAWIQEQSRVLAERIVMVLGEDHDKSQSEQALTSLLLNHYHTGQKPVTDDDEDPVPNAEDDHQGKEEKATPPPARPPPEYQDPLLPPVAFTILAAGVPTSAAAVMFSHIVPHFMPILALTTQEREQAAQLLHRQFYLLACYHLPSLVLHLDRYLSPSWFLWPNYSSTNKKKDGEGFIPQSYLMSHLAGECAVSSSSSGDGDDAKTQASQLVMMNPNWVLALWDLILSSSNNSLRFFLVLAVLESQADQLVLLTGDALKEKLTQVLRFHQEDNSNEGAALQDSKAEATTSNQEATKWVQKWTDKAQTIWEQTPVSMSRRLRRIEDQAVTEALTKRQQEAEERLKRKLEAQAKAHQEAMEAERERKADEARLRLTRARLVAFYRQYSPAKEANIDKIMETYEGRYEVLDSKLKQKYGVGFNPALKPPKPAAPARNPAKPAGFAGRNRKDDVTEEEIAQRRRRNQIVPRVAPSEVMPVVCWSKKANKVRLHKLEKGNKLEENEQTRLPLRYFLVDSRPVETANDQGRFPTALSLPPDDLIDPDRMKQQEEMFEGLRGSSHIVIMGEGFAALPGLYGQKMTQGLAECIREDDGRNNNCALFFLKQGFPYVSTLDGGFAGAHAFLCREGKKHDLRVNDVLSDYNPDVSIFGQFERALSATGREKAQRALQSIFDSSMVALTKNTRRFESLASEVGVDDKNQNKKGNMVARFFAGGSTENVGKKNEQPPEPPAPDENKGGPTGPVFRNPFARRNQPMSREGSNASLDVESVDDLDAETPGQEAAPTNDGPPKPPPATRQGSNSAPTNVPKPPAPQGKPKPAEPPKNNPFAGFGAAFKAASKVAAGDGGNAGIRGINPFARFNQHLDRSQHGMGNSKHGGNSRHGLGGSKHGLDPSQDSKKSAEVPAINFAGFNQFRKNTFNRMRTAGDGSSDSIKSGEKEDGIMEAVAVDQTSSAVGISEQEQANATEREKRPTSTPVDNDTAATEAKTDVPPSEQAPPAPTIQRV